MKFRVLDNPTICKRCGTASQVMLLDGICGGCITRKDVDSWLDTIRPESSCQELAESTDELRKQLRADSAQEGPSDDALLLAGAAAVGRQQWFEEHASSVKKDPELCRLLERAGAGDVKSGGQAIRRMAIYQVIWNGQAKDLLAQLLPARDAREAALFKIASSRRRESQRSDAIAKIMAGRKLEIGFD